MFSRETLKREIEKEIGLLEVVLNRADWAEKMLDYARDIEPSAVRAQALNIYNLLKRLSSSISEMMCNDHRSIDGALRASKLLVAAGLAEHVRNEREAKHHLFGYFRFVDGSVLNQFGVGG